MTIERKDYSEVRTMMKPGDVIAFGGKGHFSELIKFATRSDVSHVGVILQTRVVDDTTGRFFNQIIESTSLNDYSGVVISRLSDRLNTYDGEMWWLPLNESLRSKKFDSERFYNFLFNQARERKGYDVPQALQSAVDVLDDLPFGLHGPGYNREDFSRFFCSELVAAGLEKAGTVGPVNASEVTPIDLCRWNIYAGTYYQLKGQAEKQISRYNALDPAAWNV
ncbi:hypothetical protein DSCA_47770 [Desulfosarcina alkanivorans]|uniref:Peptidoglycan peptidase n=1 Tax=Desulfosarcina alkanivorans TaxID=571177 RepID=A0A5K7Z2F2_9BACT|nr:hypothetical protein [Desulfosarcina alkanivorans]BBO70847.1 hypothetical protein DSCA_47770 [Desulfosarcina alkanivorans]